MAIAEDRTVYRGLCLSKIDRPVKGWSMSLRFIASTPMTSRGYFRLRVPLIAGPRCDDPLVTPMYPPFETIATNKPSKFQKISPLNPSHVRITHLFVSFIYLTRNGGNSANRLKILSNEKNQVTREVVFGERSKNISCENPRILEIS